MPRSFLPRESDEQRVVVDWCRMHGIGIFAVPNGVKIVGPWRYAQVQRAKQNGMLAGAPDLVLIDLAPLTSQPVCIEMKRAQRATVKPAQLAVHAVMRDAGWKVIVARGAHDAIEQLRSLGYGERLLKRSPRHESSEHQSSKHLPEVQREIAAADGAAQDDS